MRSCLSAITLVKLKGKTSFSEQNHTRTTLQISGVAGCRSLQKKLGVVVWVSFIEETNNAHYNSVVSIDVDETDLGIYKKSHIRDGPGKFNGSLGLSLLCFVSLNATREKITLICATLALR